MANDWLLLLAGSFKKPGTVSAFSKHGTLEEMRIREWLSTEQPVFVPQQEVETMVLGLPLLWQRDKP